MTVKIKTKLQTMRTGDMDLQGGEAHEFLSAVADEHGQGEVDSSRTIITRQQKIKFVMHMLILVVVHVFCFWFLPI